MNSDQSLNFSVDSTLPDLLPEESLFNDLITHPDIATLNRRLDQISLNTNTQSLRIDVEKANDSDWAKPSGELDKTLSDHVPR